MAVSIYSKFESALLKAVKKRYSEGNPDAIYGDTRKLAEQFMIEFSIADAERKKVERDVMKEWVGKNSKTTNTGSQEGKLGQSSGINSFATMAGKLNRDVKRVVDRGLRSNYKLDQIEALIKRATSHGKHQSRTIARTAKLGKIRADYITESLRLGYEYFRYSGPSSDRDFCSIHINKIYHISEILKLDNKQGLLVLIYMGGWNCRHRWERVYGTMAKNIYIEKTWSEQYKKANDKDKATMKKEFGNGRLLKEIDSNSAVRFTTEKAGNSGQVDAMVNNRKAEFKNPVSTKEDILRETLKKAKGQADDVYIFIENEKQSTEIQIKRAQKWLYYHRNKKVYIVNKFEKNIIEVRYDNIIRR